MSVVQGNQKSADRFALWKQLKELEKSISTQLQPVYKSNNGQNWNPNLRAQSHVICLHITVETVFRGHPQDQAKCSLNGSWAEVILFRNLLQSLFQSARKCIKKSWLSYLWDVVCKIPTSAVHLFKWGSSCGESCHHCDSRKLKLKKALCGQSLFKVFLEWLLNLGFETQKKCPFPTPK